MNGRQKQAIKEPIRLVTKSILKALPLSCTLLFSLPFHPSLLFPSLSLNHLFLPVVLHPHLLSSHARLFSKATEQQARTLTLLYFSYILRHYPLFVGVNTHTCTCICTRMSLFDYVFYVRGEVRVIRNRACLWDNGK